MGGYVFFSSHHYFPDSFPVVPLKSCGICGSLTVTFQGCWEMSWFLLVLLGNFAHVPCGRTDMGQTDARLSAQSVSQGCFFSPPQGLACPRTERPLIVLTASTGRYRSPQYVHHYTLSPSDPPTSTVVFWVLPWIKADQREPQEMSCGGVRRLRSSTFSSRLTRSAVRHPSHWWARRRVLLWSVSFKHRNYIFLWRQKGSK